MGTVSAGETNRLLGSLDHETHHQVLIFQLHVAVTCQVQAPTNVAMCGYRRSNFLEILPRNHEDVALPFGNRAGGHSLL